MGDNIWMIVGEDEDGPVVMYYCTTMRLKRSIIRRIQEHMAMEELPRFKIIDAQVLAVSGYTYKDASGRLAGQL